MWRTFVEIDHGIISTAILLPSANSFKKSCKPNIYVSWSTSELRVRLVPKNRFKPSSKIFLLTVPRRYFFCGSFVVLCLVFLMLSRLFIAALWSPDGKGLTSWLLMVFLLYFYYFPMWYPGSGVVLDCIVSWSLPSFLLKMRAKFDYMIYSLSLG